MNSPNPAVIDYQELRAELKLVLQGKVVAMMEDQKLSTRRLAKQAGLTCAMVKDIRSGRVDPKLSTIGRLARGLGVPITELMP